MNCRGGSFFFIRRNKAIGYRAFITFHLASNGRQVIGNEMTGRWVGSREPLSPVITNQGTLSYLPDPSVVRDDLDIYAGQREALDVAVRFDQEDDCYGWSNESVLVYAALASTALEAPQWRLPGRRDYSNRRWPRIPRDIQTSKFGDAARFSAKTRVKGRKAEGPQGLRLSGYSGDTMPISS